MNAKYKASQNFDPEQEELDVCVDLDAISKYAQEKYDEWESFFWTDDGAIKSWGISGRVGYQSLNYMDEGSLDKKTDNEIPWSVKAYYSILPRNTPLLFSLSYEYQEGYKDQKTKTVCPVSDIEAGRLDCVTGVIGKPIEDNREIVALEMRQRLESIGLSLKLSYDFEKNVFGADMPVYLWKDAKGGLGGGIRFGWRDDTEDLTVGVFVNAKGFSIF